MPALDRRVTVRVTIQTTNEAGELIENLTDHEVWATRRDLSATDVAREGGQLSTATRVYTVRWRREFIEFTDTSEDPPATKAVLPSMISVIDPDLGACSPLSADEVITAAERGPLRERRRFIEFTVTGETTI